MDTKALGELQKALVTARSLLWQDIQLGGFTEPALALATIDAYKSVDKAFRLVESELGQLPLIKGG